MFLLPHLIETRQSKINGLIQVYKLWGKYSLRVDNLTQSGGLVKDIWQKALQAVKQYQPSPVKTCLILGLGGGTAAALVNHFWPQAHITAIELDPVMIKLGKKYLNLNKVQNLTIVQADASRWVIICRQKFDLILVDLYHGHQPPAFVFQTAFLRQLNRLKSPQGVIIFNFLHSLSLPRLDHHFSQIKLIKTPANRLLLVK